MSNSFLDSLEIGLDGNVAAQDGASTASADPIGAIERVALQKGINPDHLIGLAKLETRLGDATIKGDGQDTYNLFNIKDFSRDGTGIRARDKAEGSNDRYRKYGSYEESAQDLIGLLERRYPAALNASTPEEFAKALKAGGYATDPAYVQKLTRTIGSNSTPGAGAQNGGQKAEGASFLDALSTDDILNLSLNGSDGLVESAYKPIKDRTGGQMAGDLALSLTQGGIGAVKSLTDLAGADNSASAWLDDASKELQSAKSEYAQQTAANSQKRIEEAKGQGTMAEIGAYLDAIWDAPLDMTAQAAGSLLPFLFTGVAGAGAKALGIANAAKKAGVAKEVFLKSPAGQMAAKEIAKTVGGITSKANIGMGIGMGLGGVKGQQYETTLKEAKAKGLSDAEAKKLATEAQAYGGSVGGTLQQLGGAALGGIGAATGPLERALSRIPSATSSGRGVIGRTLVGGMKESVPEGMQGAQQAWAGNEAAVGAGVMDASRRFEGVAGQGIQEAVLSFPMGGVAGALEAGPAPQPAPQKPPPTPIATPPAAPTQSQTPPPAAPAAQPTATPVPADPQMAAMSDADLNALIEAIDAADDDAVTDEQWTQYALAVTEANRRADAAGKPRDADVDVTYTDANGQKVTEFIPATPADAAPLPTYMPGPEVNANRAKEQPKVVLQNRDRSGAASVLQMANIAANPDFLRVGPSTEMTTGAPVVFGDLPATAITGRPETVVDGKGDRIQAQYAVVDAGDLIPSNNADGTSVQAYENGLPGKLRAVAGNGRTAGIQKAYQQGTADQYRQDLIDQAQNMGLDADAIRGMQQPVLVRVMDAADVRDDMGDRTNISGTQRLSPVEQAANDARRLNLADLSFDDNGSPTQESLRQFISAMEDSEKGDLMGGKSGAPTKQAIDRLMAATFKQAYDSDELVDLYAQAPEPEARAILNAAGEAAGALAALKEMNPDFDVREAVADAVKLAVNASRQGMPLAEFAQNADLDIHPDAFPVARFLSQYANKPRQMANGLREWANDVLGQAEIDRTNQSQGGLFGAKPTLTREELFARLGNIDPNDQFSIQAREALAKREAEKSAAQELPQPVAIDDIPDDLQPEDVVEAPSDFDLEAQTPEQLQAQADERAAEEKRQRNAEQAAEAKAQADAEVDSFTLTGSDRPADANPNQGDLLAADQPQQGDVLNNVGQPFTSPKAAEIKAKKDGKGGQVVPVQGGYVVRMPQNMSGKASGTMGTRTDFKAGPGFTAADVVRRDPIAGQKISDEWTAFSPQSGTLGIPRAQMPQVKASDRGAMVNFLKARGIDSSKEQLPPTALKPTQAEFSPAKVQEAADRTDGDRSIIVSADGHVVDGHHQWLAQRQKGEPINVIRLDQPITQVLDALKEMPSAQPEQKQGGTPANDGAMPPEFASFEAKTWLLISSPELVGADNNLNERGQAIARTPWSELSVQDRELVTKLSKAKQSASDAYNTYVQKQEKDAERRRLQGDNIIQQANGKPFKTETSAQAKLDEFDLADTHAIQKTDKGFVLRRMPPAEQAERRRKAEGRESYMEAQSAVLAEMGIGETADGEIDATDEQFAEIERRTAERLGRNAQPADSKPNQPLARTAKQRRGDAVQTLQETRNSTDALLAMYGDGLDPADDVIEVIQRAASGFDTSEKKKLNRFIKKFTKPGKNGTYITNERQFFDLLPEQFGYSQWLLSDAINDLANEAQNQPLDQAQPAPSASDHPASWFVVDKSTGEIVMETSNKAAVDALETSKYEAFEAYDYLAGLNRSIKRLGNNPDKRRVLDDVRAAAEDRRVAKLYGDGAEQPAAQAQAATENVAQQSPQDFIPAPDGGLDYGEITPDMGRAMRRQAGKIRLQHGVQNADGTGWGLVHIEARHGKEIRSAGFESVEQFLADAFRNVDEVWKPGSTSQLIAVQSGRTGKIAFVQLEADRQGGKDFYRINSAFPANEKYVARKERKEGWKPLWSRYPVPADASGASGFVGQSPEAGETTPTVSGQSGATSVPPTAAAAQPVTRADVEAAQQQAAAIIGERIESMTPDEVKRIARGFLPSMGLKPSPSKKVNKASMTSAKINLMAAAAEVGATLPAEVTRALMADMEGRVVDVAQDDGTTETAAQAQTETPTPTEPNPLEHTPKQYADAWLRWSAETNGLPLAEVREMQGDEAGLKAIEQRWVDAVVQEAKSGKALPAKTLDKLLEIRPNAVLPESAIPDGYQRPEARKSEKEEAQARADNRRAAKQGAAPADASLEEIFTGLDSSGLPKTQATNAAKAHPQSDLIEQVNSQFHDLLLDLMETQGVLEVNGQTTETEDNKSCL